ncbi:mechanosensitive ion channel family protein [Fibrobacterales bacterium]|nr:mechanosensitive ion channel family protein [Fibrobacterales bacterium]
MLVTHIRTPQNEDITLPNSNVLSGHTVNYTTAAETIGIHIKVSISIGYDVKHTVVEELLMKASQLTAGVVNNPKSFVLIKSLEDFYIAYELNASLKSAEAMPRIKSNLHAHILDCFNEAGIEILSPHYRAERSGDNSTIISSIPDLEN